ncbi:MAG: DUF2254 domain-containing protein, partial [Methyloceanibacter sp.]|uniref:DUF2254 domain-containing protein n=1 Tax=Methyloceanibacter sp. TaxID=1965321 RepID=UPI003D9AFF89
DAGTARDLLSSLLSGMITMTSLVVSITMVVLSLAAGQLGPRLIGNFIQDRQIHMVLGLFMGTILYTLIVLRSVTDQLGPDTVPHIAITVASALTMLCLFALLFYVHKIARSIIADTVVKEVANDLEHSIAGAAREEQSGPTGEFDPSGYRYQTYASLGDAGYVQVVDYNGLVSCAEKDDLLIRTLVRPGHFVLRGGNHVEIFSNDILCDGFAAKLRSAFVIGAERTPTQDLEFSVRQLVEIAVRALSTGINDPFTAIAVINRLGAALESVSRRPSLPVRYRDERGQVRVVTLTTDFPGLLDVSFNQIRQAASGNAAILIQMSRIIGQLALIVEGQDSREALLAHLDKIERSARRTLADPSDLEDFTSRADEARKRLAAPVPHTLMPENSD